MFRFSNFLEKENKDISEFDKNMLQFLFLHFEVVGFFHFWNCVFQKKIPDISLKVLDGNLLIFFLSTMALEHHGAFLTEPGQEEGKAEW